MAAIQQLHKENLKLKKIAEKLQAKLRDTENLKAQIAQPIAGVSSSTNYTVDAGFWVGAGEVGPSGYAYLPGDVNMALGIWPPSVIGGDVTYLVGYFIGGGQESCLLDGF